MNWVILAAIALYFIATAVDDVAMGWHFDGPGSFNVRISNDDYSLRIRSQGDVDLAADGSGVAGLSTGDSLDVRMTRTGVERRVLFTSESGTVEKQFYVEADEQPWGPEADRFVTEVMPIVLRETAINADQRVAWLIDNRGPDGLLDEIELIQSDFAQRVYTVHYAETAAIAAADFARLMSAAAEHMGSDFDLRTTLTAVFDAQMPAGESLVALLAAGKTIGSDFDARTLLEHLAPHLSDSEAAPAYFELVETIGSDFDHREALAALANGADLTPAGWRMLLDSTQSIGSDFDAATLLMGVAPRLPRDEEVLAAYRAALATIANDFDRQRAAAALDNANR